MFVVQEELIKRKTYICMNMKKLVTLFFLCLLVSAHLTGQISHGGRPLPMTILSTRSGSLFQEMPAFDIAEQLRIDSLNESDLRSSFHFAYKFMTDFTPDNSGSWFTQPTAPAYGGWAFDRPVPIRSMYCFLNTKFRKEPSSSCTIRTRHIY